jgi:hypothetical protein
VPPPTLPPLDELPESALFRAKHPATVPPVVPVQFQIHEEVPSEVTAEAVPAVHRLVVGAELMVAPLAEPHAPSVTVLPPLDESVPDELLPEPLDDELPDELPLEEPLLEPELLEPPLELELELDPLLPPEDDPLVQLAAAGAGAPLMLSSAVDACQTVTEYTVSGLLSPAPR